MVWGITGYTARGGRQALDNPLRAYQFHTGRVNIFGGGTNIQNNYYYNNMLYDDSYYMDMYGENSNKGLWNWVTGLSITGGVLSAFGRIANAIWGDKGQKPEGGGSTNIEVQKSDIAVLKDTYRDNCRISGPMSNGSYYIIGKDGKKTLASDFDDLQAKLQEMYDSEAPEAVNNGTGATPATSAAELSADEEPAISATEDFEVEPSMIELYKQNGITDNVPVKAGTVEFGGDNGDVEIGDMVGVFDDDPNIGNFENAKFEKVIDSEQAIVQIGGRTYKSVSKSIGDGCVYLQDITPGTNGTQIYILEFNKTTQKYELHQRSFLSNTEGFGIAAKKTGDNS